MLSVRYLVPKILMAASYCGCQLGGCQKVAVGGTHPYLEKEGTSSQPRVCQHSLQYDGWPG